MTNGILIAIALITLGTAAVAMTLRNLIHSALLLIATWAGVAAFYLWAGAEFVAFAQLLVYVGAVSMVVLFAVLLTRPATDEPRPNQTSLVRVIGALLTGGAILGVLFGAVLSSRFSGGGHLTPGVPVNPGESRGLDQALTVRQLGLELLGPHALALLIVAALLTVALLGAAVIASGTPRAAPLPIRSARGIDPPGARWK